MPFVTCLLCARAVAFLSKEGALVKGRGGKKSHQGRRDPSVKPLFAQDPDDVLDHRPSCELRPAKVLDLFLRPPGPASSGIPVESNSSNRANNMRIASYTKH